MSSKYYANWNTIEKEIDYTNIKKLQSENLDESILEARTIFYTAPPIRVTKMTAEIHSIGFRINMVKSIYRAKNSEEEKYTTDSFEDIDLVIVDEINRLKIQSL